MNSQVEQVTQADREAAWPFAGFHCLPDSQMRQRWFGGYYDTLPTGGAIRAFAAHRLASLASQPPVLDEREVIERCAKVADEEVAARRGQQKMAVINNFLGGQLDAALRIATAIRNLGGPDDVA